jgi:hypothetical protein
VPHCGGSPGILGQLPWAGGEPFLASTWLHEVSNDATHGRSESTVSFEANISLAPCPTPDISIKPRSGLLGFRAEAVGETNRASASLCSLQIQPENSEAMRGGSYRCTRADVHAEQIRASAHAKTRTDPSNRKRGTSPALVRLRCPAPSRPQAPSHGSSRWFGTQCANCNS